MVVQMYRTAVVCRDFIYVGGFWMGWNVGIPSFVQVVIGWAISACGFAIFAVLG